MRATALILLAAASTGYGHLRLSARPAASVNPTITEPHR